MRTTVFVPIALTVLAIACPTRASELFTNIVIDVNEEWFNSGVYVNYGDTLYITGFGAFSAWRNQEIWFNVASPGPFLGDVTFTVPGYPAPALIGRIGPTQKFMASGTVAFVSRWYGPLYFTLNDQAGAYADNRGTVVVWLRLKRASIVSGDVPPPTPDDAMTLGQNHPNPFQGETRIDFTMDEPADVKVVIYDGAGRIVRNLLQASLTAGVHSLVWDGRDDQGVHVPSGVYVCRVHSGGENAVIRMVMLK